MLHSHSNSVDNSMSRNIFPSILAFDSEPLITPYPNQSVNDAETIFFKPKDGLKIEDTLMAVYYPDM